ncbi:glycosyltransferase [Sphingomonas sp. PP-CC-1A-547]|uniref:glycosyltransferase n=1 Tax=Sphingomonas sp. PP-CC-1A-547 TaxID=2135654 RepID=UPI0011C48F15|nr:glycosyltransferase [Sphingomonas sp. PP-CC-1A-547]
MIDANRPVRVAVVYHIWPHYRAAVVAAMDRSTLIEYDFFGSGEALNGIEHMDPGLFRRFVKAPFRLLRRVMWQPKAVEAALSKKYDALIYLADMNFASTWVAASIARLRGKPVLFWAHGWLKPESGAKAGVRNTYFGLADCMLLYAERGKRLGVASGYSADKITVVYNSLDVDKADAVVARIESGLLDTDRPQSLFADPTRPLVICTARITRLCRFDLLLQAAALLKERGIAINILLVGDGPERPTLERISAELDLSVHFYGACYDEDVTGQLIYHSDLTVSPGKIGLTAMHTLMYGTPAITHDDLNEQMPEVEALTPDVTGKLFRRDDPTSLGDAISGWLSGGHDRAIVRSACRAAVHDRWNPYVQATIIERAVLKLTSRG